MIQLTLLAVLSLPSIVFAELWNCGGVYSSKPKDANCSLVKNSSTKCISNGFRKISLVKKGEEVVEEKCARTDPEKKSKKTAYSREEIPSSYKSSEGYLDIEKYEEERKIARMAIDNPIGFSRELSRPTDEDDRFFESASGMDMNQAREDLRAFKSGEVPEDYQ